MLEIMETNMKKNELTLPENLSKATTKINDFHKIAKNAIFGISLILADIFTQPNEYLENSGFSSLAEYAEKAFGYKKAYTYKLVKIARFVEILNNETGDKITVTDLINNNIEGNYSFNVLMDGDNFEYSPSQLLELIPLTSEQINENLQDLDSSLSCKELREKVKNIVSPPIETSAEIKTEGEEQTDEKTVEENKPLTDKEKILQMLEITSTIENEEVKNKIILIFQKALKVLEK